MASPPENGTFEEKLKYWQNRDTSVAKNADHYNELVGHLLQAGSKREMERLSMPYMMNMEFDRADICLAYHTIEWARGWR